MLPNVPKNGYQSLDWGKGGHVNIEHPPLPKYVKTNNLDNIYLIVRHFFNDVFICTAKSQMSIDCTLNPVLFMSLFGHALFNYNPPQAQLEGLVIF